MKNITTNDIEVLEQGYKALDDKFGVDITIIDIREVSVLADYFIITSGENPNQIKAMADEISNKFFELGIPIKHSEGYSNTLWILLDFGNIIVHIFNKESRSFYNLERIWGDAPRIQVSR